MQFGLSSDVYKVELIENSNGITPHVFIYRRFKLQNIHTRLSHEKQNSIYRKMSDLKVGPNFYGGDSNFRIEEFIDSKVIRNSEINIPEIRRKLAVKLALFHRANIDLDNKLGHIEIFLNNKEMMDQISKNFETIKDEIADVQYQEIIKIKSLLTVETIKYINSHLPKEKYVMCHNDIWVGNLLLTEIKNVFYIDYEMIALNFPGYDVAKLILETMFERSENGPDYKFREDLMPNDDEIKDFIHYYLRATILHKDKLEESDIDSYINVIAKEEAIAPYERMMIDGFFKQVILGMMVVGYYTSLLGMYIGSNKNFGMDFVQFAIDGHNIYLKYKEKLTHNLF